MNRFLPALTLLVTIFFLGPQAARAHCEIPCGLYDDQARVKLIAEHTDTIDKSIQQILALQKAESINYNQMVRWVMNKDNHADQIQEIVSQYFMTQRIKTDSANYERKIVVLHRMLIAAMKCKQTTDLRFVEELRALLKTFDQLYFN